MRLRIGICMGFAAVTAVANDYFAEIGIGGVTLGKSEHIVMESERLEIAQDRIQVDYIFVNRGPKDETATVVFPLPPVQICNEGARDSGHCRDHILDLAFETWVDGKKLRPGVDFRAITRQVIPGSETDWTAYLERHRLGEKNAEGKERTVYDLPSETIDEMERKGLVKRDLNASIRENWRTQRSFVREQTFPKGARVKVRHAYAPQTGVGQGMPPVYDADPEKAKFCVDAPTARAFFQMHARHKDPGTAPSHAFLTYILTTANSWKGPIGDFHLILKKKRPDEVISACFDGLKKTSPTTFEARRKNFRPERDLSVLYYWIEPPKAKARQ